MKTSLPFIALFSLILLACDSTTEPIAYGKDNCHLCQMRIMDQKFGAEVVTDKGRVYKFDSGECMLNYLNETDDQHSHMVVTNFEAPGNFLDATQAWYLVSKKMPSPMGGYLNAFEDEATAKSYQEKNGGEVYDWKQIRYKYTR